MTLLPRLFAVLVVSFSALIGAAAAADPRQQGAALTTQFYEGHIDALWERMTPQMQAGLQSPQNLVALREQVLAGWGAETELVSEKVEKVDGFDTYLRQARFARSPDLIQVLWAIDADGRIGGFYIRPLQTTPPQAAASGFLDYQTRTRLQLPFDDEYFVFWGVPSNRTTMRPMPASASRWICWWSAMAGRTVAMACATMITTASVARSSRPPTARWWR